MNHYNFDQIIERRGTYSSKWDNVGARIGNPDALPMWVADMDFRSPDIVVEAIQKRVSQGIFGYPFLHKDFADAVCGWQQKCHGWQVDHSSVCYVSSVIPAMFAAVQCFTKPKEKVLIMRPVYYPFTHAIEDSGREVKSCALIECGGKYTIDFDKLDECASDPDVKLMLLCNPHNPVGRVYTEEELKKIAEICIRHQVIIFSDEIHGDIVYEPNRHIPIASISEEIGRHVVTAVAPSKTFNLAGLRTAAVIVENPELRARIQQQFNINKCALVSTFGMDACIAAYRGGEEYLSELLVYLQDNIKYLDKYLKENLPVIKLVPPEGTYLMWLDCRELKMSNEELDDFFTNQAEVGLDKGFWFGEEGSGFMRMNIACPRKILETALDKIKVAYEKR